MKKLFTLFLFALLAITSAWAETLTYTYALNDPTAYPKDFPKSNGTSASAKEFSISGHPLIINASSYYIINPNNTDGSRGLFFGKSATPLSDATSYLQFPAVEGYTLKKVDVTTTSGQAKETVCNIYSTAWSAMSTNVTLGKNTTSSFTLNDPQSNTAYRFATKTSGKNIQLTGITLTYESTSTTPGKTATSLSFGADWDGKTITKYIGEGIFNRPATLTPAVEGATITYSSSDTKVAIIDENGDILLGDAVGKTTITASYAGNDTYDASSASFTIDLQKLPVPTFSEEDGAYVEKGSVVNLYVPSTPAFCKIMCTINDVDEIESSGPVSIPINATTKIFAFTVCTIDGVQVTSEGVTKTYYAKELSSIAISGTPSKTTYAPGDVFSTDGLTVTATYNNGSTADVTSDVAWSFDPATFATEGSQNVAVTATYNGKTATENYTVTVETPTSTTYTLVTSTDDLVDGAKYVLVETGGTRAASKWSSSAFSTVAKGPSSYTIDGDVVTVIGDVAIFTLTADGKQWKISDDQNRQFGCSKSSASITSTGNSSFHVTFNTDNTVNIKLSTDATRNWMFNTDGYAIKYYATSTSSAKNLKLYKSNAQVVVKPAAPTFDPVSGTAFDTETATVTITAPEGCILKYTVGSGEEQTSASNTAQVTVSPTAYTITAKSVNADGVESNEATATYTFNVVAHVKNIAEFLALADNTTAIFDNPVVVLYDYSQPSTHKNDAGEYSNPEYIWVKDESGQTNLYLEVAFDTETHVAHYENGDVIPAGFKATKNLYDKGNFYQALVDATNKATLKDATLKHLADPVTITFDEFNALQVGSDAHIAKWNNTYVMIPKVTMAADETDTRGKTYNVSQNGVAATSNVFYNKYSDLRDGEYALTKQGEDARVTMPTSSTIEYNVYGILQVFDKVWEIMPIRFVPYSEQTVTLKELVELGNNNKTDVNTVYTILNDLRGVRALPDGALPDRVILAKDENGNAVDKVTPAGNSFMINAKSKFDDAATEESVNAKAQEDYDQSNWVEIVLPEGVSAANYVDHIITGMTVKGNYTDTTNPRLVATAAPTAGGPTGAYTRNAMCPANFMGTSQACNAEQNHGDFFFMTPKPNECVQVVWAVYNSTAKAFYIPAAQGSINSHGFKGAFSIDWAYNADGKITNLTDGNLYQFAAVVKKIEPAPQSPKRKIAYVNNQPLSSDYVVFPLNLDANYVTGITETTGTKTVKSVRYFNIMGVELAEPTAGVNIVLTTYTDGTTHSQKILK